MRAARRPLPRLLPAAAALLLAAGGCTGGGSGARPIDFRRVIAEAKRRVFPAIVFVKPIREEYSRGEKKKQEVVGSGAIISPDGLVFTNAHVAEKASDIRCVLENRRQYKAELVGLDKETDLALLQLELPEGHPPLPVVEFADSSRLEEGQFVMTMGSPFGFQRSISFGVISNTGRYLGFTSEYRYNLWLQTDAAINPGNSGGPLVDSEGRVVGINTLSAWFAENVGFAIPSNIAREVLTTLREKGSVPRSWVGFEIQALEDFDQNTFHTAREGLLVAGVDDPSPAAEAGLKNGDLILAINGGKVTARYVEDLPAARRLLAALPAEQPAQMLVKRKGEVKTLKVTPVAKGEFEGKDFDADRWDMTVKGITRYATPRLYFFNGNRKGVFVQGVRWPGNAQNAGLQARDIIAAIKVEEEKGPVKITDVDQFEKIYRQLLADPKREKNVLLVVRRGPYTKHLVLDYRRTYEDEGAGK
ncbi:MAG: S1C family serine protease [Planctomycetota bacterium]